MQTVENLAGAAPNTWIGQVFADRYELVQIVGGSDRWVVFEARDKITGAPLGVTALRPEILVNPAAVDRFERAAKAAVDLPPHPNIVSAYDWGREGQVRFVVTEWLDGPSLKVILERGEPVSVGQSIHIAGEVGAALDFAQRRGISISSVDPSMVWTSGPKIVKLNSMGLSEQGESQPPVAGARRSKHSGPASVSALGLMLYRMLAGVEPASLEQPGQKSGSRPAPLAPPSSINPSVPTWLDEVILSAIGRNHLPPYPSIARMREALGHRNPQPVARYGARKGRPRWRSDFMALILVFVALVSVLGAYGAYRGISQIVGTTPAAAKHPHPGGGGKPGTKKHHHHHRIGNNTGHKHHGTGSHHRRHHHHAGGVHGQHHHHTGVGVPAGSSSIRFTYVRVNLVRVQPGTTMQITYTVDNIAHHTIPVRLRAHFYTPAGATLTDPGNSTVVIAQPGKHTYQRPFVIALDTPNGQFGLSASTTQPHGHKRFGHGIHVPGLIIVAH